MSISRRSIFERLKAKGHSIGDQDFILKVRDFLMEEFGRTDDYSKEALEAIAKKMVESVRDLMKGGTGPNKSRTGIDRLLGRSRNKVHYSLFHWILGRDFALKKY